MSTPSMRRPSAIAPTAVSFSRYAARRLPAKAPESLSDDADPYESEMAEESALVGSAEWKQNMRMYNMQVISLIFASIAAALMTAVVVALMMDSDTLARLVYDFRQTRALETAKSFSDDYAASHRQLLNNTMEIASRLATTLDTVLTNQTTHDVINTLAAMNHFMARVCITFSMGCDHPHIPT